MIGTRHRPEQHGARTRHARYSCRSMLSALSTCGPAALEAHGREEFTPGLTVALHDNKPGEFGTVLTRAGERVRVDFSQSGGGSSWRSYKELAIVDVLNLSGASDQSDPATSDDEPDITDVATITGILH